MASATKQKSKESSSELFQTVLLTLAMVGAGLMGLLLVLEYYMLPDVEASVEKEKREYEQLTRLLDSDEMHRLRAQAEAAEEEGQANLSLQGLILDSQDATGVRQENISAPRFREGAEVRRVRLQPANLGQIFRFVVGVKGGKKTVEVVEADFRQNRRAAERGVYEATIEFVDYAPPQG